METSATATLPKYRSDSSDPTYEAWKLSFIFLSYIFYLLCSDPTYEAWKPKYLVSLSLIEGVPILPTRHGNF